MLDLVVIGAGPAGISAAIYAKSRGLDLVVLEKKQVGGIIGNVSTVTHYSGIVANESGASFRKRLEEQATNSGIEIKYEEVVSVELNGKVKKIVTKENVYEAKAVILANGSTPRTLNIPGDELRGKGMYMNAANDGEKYIGKNVYVVGGADGAIKEAIYLTKFAKTVNVVHFEDKLGCIDEFKNKVAKLNNMNVILNSRLVKVYGENHVTGLDIKNESNGEIKHIDDECGIFVYAGLVPNTNISKDIELTNDGYINVNNKMETNIAGVYACGDIVGKQVRQVATAVSDGAIAAINASVYCKNN